MTTLHQKIISRNKTFNENTKTILEPYVDKLNSVAFKLLHSDVDIEWNYINNISDLKDLITIHGLLPVTVGDIISDESGQYTRITEENRNDFQQYIKIMVSSARLETATVDELVNDIKELHKVENQMKGDDFQMMDMPKVRH